MSMTDVKPVEPKTQAVAKNFTIRTKEYFGLKKDQNNTQFAGELKELTPKDKLMLAEGFEAMDLPIADIAAIRENAAKA